MLFKSSLVIAATLLATTPVLAQGVTNELSNDWGNSAPVNGSRGNVKYDTGKTDSVRFYQPDTTNVPSAPVHNTYGSTMKQITTSAGTVNGGPIIRFGKNTYFAPSNMALQTQNHSPFGGSLPNTTLDSFVVRSGFNDHVYGDEGTSGPPHYGSFSTIGANGAVSATTGHRDPNLPSSWY